MKLNDYFYLQELLPERIYALPDSRRFIDQRIIDFLLAIRKLSGKPVTVNNWHQGGPYQYRGYRDPECDQGAKYSMHRIGLAVDFTIAGEHSTDVTDIVLANAALWPQLTRIENHLFTPTWTHVDFKPATKPGITIFDPV